MRKLTTDQWQDAAEAEQGDDRAAVVRAAEIAEGLARNREGYRAGRVACAAFLAEADRLWIEAEVSGIEAAVSVLVSAKYPKPGWFRDEPKSYRCGACGRVYPPECQVMSDDGDLGCPSCGD
jgi:DNA-directed RNA polymerase subunit RPC12/RpoP